MTEQPIQATRIKEYVVCQCWVEATSFAEAVTTFGDVNHDLLGLGRHEVWAYDPDTCECQTFDLTIAAKPQQGCGLASCIQRDFVLSVI